MLEMSILDGLPPGLVPRLKTIFETHINIFRISFSYGPPITFSPFKINLSTDAKPVQYRLQNYSQDQREWLNKWRFVFSFVQHGTAYASPTSKLASAPLLVPKADVKYCFIVDLRPVNKFTVPHHFPMPCIENELTKLYRSTVYTSFDLSHGYWQLSLHRDSQ